MMALMWIAEWPAKHLSDGSPSMSTNPFADYHVIYAVALIAVAAAGAGAIWGLGRLRGRGSRSSATTPGCAESPPRDGRLFGDRRTKHSTAPSAR